MTTDNASAPLQPQVASVGSYLQKSFKLLVDSEYLLACLIKSHGLWPPSVVFPPMPVGYQPPHSLEFGIFLFLICNREYIDNSDVRDAAFAYYDAVWLETGSKPSSALTYGIYSSLDIWNLIAPDGSVVATGAFELYDQNWLNTLFNLCECVVRNLWYNGGTLPLPGADYEPVRLDNGPGTTCTVGLIGDWGAGNSAAAEVMSGLTALPLDGIIHLGDVYYSGTPTVSSHFYNPGEEQQRLIAPWPSDFTKPSFTLNSNHEMYSGANGLFEVALCDQIFASQQGFSVFAAAIADWTILGLDSAYHGMPEQLFMEGYLDSPGGGPGAGSQISWIRSLKLDPAKTIVLTHHNGFDPNCDPALDGGYLTLRQQLYKALGGLPYAWFWGHTHNAMVYDKVVLNGVLVNALCRCIGNGAVPYGVAAELNSPRILWQAAETATTDNLLGNGYAALTFTIGPGNVVTTIAEAYYTTASRTAAYSATLYPRP